MQLQFQFPFHIMVLVRRRKCNKMGKARALNDENVGVEDCTVQSNKSLEIGNFKILFNSIWKWLHYETFRCKQFAVPHRRITLTFLQTASVIHCHIKSLNVSSSAVSSLGVGCKIFYFICFNNNGNLIQRYEAQQIKKVHYNLIVFFSSDNET